ncbi:DUF3467 domain-containing protein [Patescibacteria group bacterium]
MNNNRKHQEIDKKQITLQVNNDILLAESIVITNSPMAFVLNCIQSPNKVFSRVGLSPQHAKILSQVLKNEVDKYESQFGEIKITPQMQEEASKDPMGFNTES